MRIGILYICTGKYTVFWNHFFTSCEQHFLHDHEKHYYVFTDGKIAHLDCPRVHRIEQQHLGWPDTTLKRFHMFERIADTLLHNTDFIIFFNANMVFLRDVGEEFLPTREEALVFHRHPGLFRRPAWLLPYERRPESTAYIPYGSGSIYVCGGVNGGYTKPYLDFVATLRRNIDIDAERGIIARWHDESHINRYVIGRHYKIGHPGYVYPDRRNLPFPRIIRVIDKASVGGHTFLRGQTPEPAPEEHSKTIAKKLRSQLKRPCMPRAAQDEPVVLARMMGGLGNQMFIYAAARVLAERQGAQLHLDTGKLFSDSIRQYDLPVFGIDAPLWHIPCGCDRIVQAWFTLRHLAASCCMPKPTMQVLRSGFHLDQRFFSIMHSAYLIGYWQSPHYWRGHEDCVRSSFDLARFEHPHLREALAAVSKRNTISVHLRRGDFRVPKNSDKHLLIDGSYYERARKLLLEMTPESHFYIFSDEPEEAKRLFGHWENTSFQPRHSQEEDLLLMSRCSASIIANSSFSWWGAWLGRPKQHVIAPRMWFTRDVLMHTYTLDLFPEKWILL